MVYFYTRSRMSGYMIGRKVSEQGQKYAEEKEREKECTYVRRTIRKESIVTGKEGKWKGTSVYRAIF
jgi:hypothetical protein